MPWARKIAACAAVSLLVFVRPADAQVAISQLPSATALGGTEVAPVVQSGATVKATINQIDTYIAGKTHTWGLTQTFTVAPVFTDQAGSRTALGLGTAATQSTSAFAPATSGTAILYGNGTGGFSSVTVGSGLSFSGGALTASASSLQAATFQNQQTNGTADAESVSTSWVTATLNTAVANSITGASLSSNQISLPAGTYLAVANVPIYSTTNGGSVRCRIQNVTDSSTLAFGTNIGTATANQGLQEGINGAFTLSGAKTIAVQCYSTSASNIGAGAQSAGVVETYTTISLTKIG